MLIETFLDYLRFERNYSDKTVIAYRKDLVQLNEYAQAEVSDFSFLELSPELIRDWIVSLMEKGYTESSVNRKLSSIRSFYKYLLKKSVVKQDPLRKIVGPKKKKVLPVFVKEADMDEILDNLEDGDDFRARRDNLIMDFFYSTGVRLSELIGLNNEDIDFEICVIKVVGKRNKERLIPFGDQLKKKILEYISIRDRDVLKISNAFFVKEDGGCLYEGLVYNLVKRNLSKVVTVKKRSPHVLRHSFATAMLNNEAELNAVKELLGHDSLAATQIYTHATFEELKKVYKQAHPRA